MKGELIINSKDAYLEWGIVIDDTSLGALMTPPPKKEYVSNRSILRPGKEVLSLNSHIPKSDERNIKLNVTMYAQSREMFFKRYMAFCEELGKGKLVISSNLIPGKKFITYYTNCEPMTQYNGKMAKYLLQLNEPNPEEKEDEQ